MIEKYLARVRSDRGSVGVLMALFIMVAVGSLVMTWNTVQLSKEKMRLQAAADSAALSACVWQARGMNAVQNINDDMYVTLSLASKLITIATPFQAVGVICWKARFVPFIGPFFEVIAVTCFSVAMLLGGTSAWMVNVCQFIYVPLQYFYVNFSAALGFLGAMQLAAKNGASRLLTGSESKSSGLTYGLFTIGTSAVQKDLFLLPLKEATGNETGDTTFVDKIKNVNNKPWKHGAGALKELLGKLGKGVQKIFNKTSDESKITPDTLTNTIWTNPALVPSSVAKIHKTLGTGGPWEFHPYVTPQKGGKNVLPSPVLFIVRRNSEHVETIDMKWWDPDFESRPAKSWPILAVAAAQCITGDVIPHSKEPAKTGVKSARPGGFGTGATARLVPIREFAQWAESVNNKVSTTKICGGIFH